MWDEKTEKIGVNSLLGEIEYTDLKMQNEEKEREKKCEARKNTLNNGIILKMDIVIHLNS